jgi:SAM-dependent methyltransferase
MSERTREMVRANYGAVARGRSGADGEALARIAASFGYSADDLSAIPAEANLGASCGNPIALASLKEGETVLDLGCGGGLDVFLAAEKVGPRGRVVGLDMTPDMIVLAKANAERRGDENVEFILAPIEAMPLPDGGIDCVISNCVLNLVSDKSEAYAEIFRVLKPGGRLAVSDIALKQALPEPLRESVTAWTGCIAGALTIDDNRAALLAAGFTDIAIVDAEADLNVYKQAGQEGCCAPVASCCAPAAVAATACCSSGTAPSGDLHADMSSAFKDIDLNDYAASVKIFALKPAAA